MRINIKNIIASLMLLILPLSLSAQDFVNGQLWNDVDGKHINAHGGNIIKYGDTYYWYGEHRPYTGFTTERGISVYSSADMRHWKNEGIALAVSRDYGDDIERGCIMERPKVVYNAKTKKFVMLFHLELKGRGYEAARVGFAQSSSPTGPFLFIRSTRVNAGKWPFDMSKKDIKAAQLTDASKWKDWWSDEWRAEVSKGMYLWRDFEGGQMSRDMTVYIDEKGTAYHIISSQENLTLLISELTDDYLDYTGKYTMVAPGGQNEAPCIFKHDGRYWLICSGCTGWAPNEARMFTSKSIWGPWEQLDSPFTGAPASYRNMPADKTFGGQGTYILTDVFSTPVFMADIWNPDHLSNSLHLWLPIDFDESGTPLIRWTDKVPEMEK
ncbi:MAG: glycoside hydrolase family 43 protein [Bacteroidaceae bacterium]|nr:glycoside hydrolase family 43 protein [Bacteroidaceae bacterium]